MGNTKELWQIEDAALKTTLQFFADELFPFFHIDGKVVDFVLMKLLLVTNTMSMSAHTYYFLAKLSILLRRCRQELIHIVYNQL